MHRIQLPSDALSPPRRCVRRVPEEMLSSTTSSVFAEDDDSVLFSFSYSFDMEDDDGKPHTLQQLPTYYYDGAHCACVLSPVYKVQHSFLLCPYL